MRRSLPIVCVLLMVLAGAGGAQVRSASPTTALLSAADLKALNESYFAVVVPTHIPQGFRVSKAKSDRFYLAGTWSEYYVVVYKRPGAEFEVGATDYYQNPDYSKCRSWSYRSRIAGNGRLYLLPGKGGKPDSLRTKWGNYSFSSEGLAPAEAIRILESLCELDPRAYTRKK